MRDSDRLTQALSMCRMQVQCIIKQSVEFRQSGSNSRIRQDCVELFSGRGDVGQAITKGFAYHGLIAKPFDIAINPCHDILSDDGLKLALSYMMRLKHYGVLWMAPPCGTWVWSSRYATKRSSKHPKGNRKSKKVVTANKQILLVADIMRLAWYLRLDFVIEQPR